MQHGLTYFVLLLLFCCPAYAQREEIWIPYSHQVPEAVRKQMPRSGRTRFFGSGKLGSQFLLFHLIKLPTTKKQSEEEQKSGEHLLNIFTRDGSHRSIRKINAVPLSTNYFNLIYVSIYWIDTKQKRIPLIELNLVEESRKGVLMFYGPEATDTFLSFAEGLSNKAEVQEFRSWGNTRESYSVASDKVDDDGYIVIDYIHQESDSDPEITSHYWNSRKFEPRQKKKPEG